MIDNKPQDSDRYEMHCAITNQVTKLSWYSHLGEIHYSSRAITTQAFFNPLFKTNLIFS
ncbi:hypothetical protein IQ247_28165 [Plectonema cf. radiosum LEGE 06105]|uniref:Uncharacterized protein n=1 Tax=Plectonema cf. radiosum LEGE 06105 TaxID=945769 RepID=A0A8J7JXA3_9CYAN|nr:hypothetical protein [Plectonema radiosum]MBE9216490.1 hypothetical protein [Plectonema cf. radiosum LEGE 06105]